jgi:hypothetical protein
LALIPATEVEWQSGRVLHPLARRVAGRAEDGDSFPYSGRTLKTSARNWFGSADMSTRLSINEAYLALFTWNGVVNYPDPFGGVLQSSRKEGRYFFDIYNVANGRKVALIRGRFHDFWPGFLIDLSFWLEGSRFVVPLSDDMRRLAVCEIQ